MRTRNLTSAKSARNGTKISHLPGKIDNRTRKQRRAEKQAIAAERRALTFSSASTSVAVGIAAVLHKAVRALLSELAAPHVAQTPLNSLRRTHMAAVHRLAQS